MALKLTESNITFNNVVAPTTIGNSKYNYAKYKDKTTGNDITRSSTEISDPVNKFINAIDIDWNGAKYGDRVDELLSEVPESWAHDTINTTGELLDEVAYLRAQIDTLTGMVEAIYENYNSNSNDDTPYEVFLDIPVELRNNSNFTIYINNPTSSNPYTTTAESEIKIIIPNDCIYNTSHLKLEPNYGDGSHYYDVYISESGTRKWWSFTMPHHNVNLKITVLSNPTPYNDGIGYDDGIGDNNYDNGIGNNDGGK